MSLAPTCYSRFMSYVGDLLEDIPEAQVGEELTYAHREWDLFLYAKAKWSVASGR